MVGNPPMCLLKNCSMARLSALTSLWRTLPPLNACFKPIVVTKTLEKLREKTITSRLRNLMTHARNWIIYSILLPLNSPAVYIGDHGSFLEFLGIKWVRPRNHLIHNYAKTPPVKTFTVIAVIIRCPLGKAFWRHIRYCPGKVGDPLAAIANTVGCVAAASQCKIQQTNMVSKLSKEISSRTILPPQNKYWQKYKPSHGYHHHSRSPLVAVSVSASTQCTKTEWWWYSWIGWWIMVDILFQPWRRVNPNG